MLPQSTLSNTEVNELYIQLICAICAEVCHRAVRLSCCQSQACRGCATREIIKTKKCWVCSTLQTTKQLNNDETLRMRIEEFKKMALDEKSRMKSANQSRSTLKKSATAVELTKSANAFPPKIAENSATPKPGRSKSRSRLNNLNTQSVSVLPTAKRNEFKDIDKEVRDGDEVVHTPRRSRSKSSSRLRAPTAMEVISTDEDVKAKEVKPRNRSKSVSNLRKQELDLINANNQINGYQVNPTELVTPSLKNQPSENGSKHGKSTNQTKNPPVNGGSTNPLGTWESHTAEEHVGVNDENIAPDITPTAPRSMSRFSGVSRLKKVGEEKASARGRNQKLDILTQENTQRNGQVDMLPQYTPETQSTNWSSAYSAQPRSEIRNPQNESQNPRNEKENPQDDSTNLRAPLEFVTPKSICRGRGQGGRDRRIGWSEVNIYYFNRTQGFSSVPRDGGNTLGMEIRHSDFKSWNIQGDSDPHVKRKLFDPSATPSNALDLTVSMNLTSSADPSVANPLPACDSSRDYISTSVSMLSSFHLQPNTTSSLCPYPSISSSFHLQPSTTTSSFHVQSSTNSSSLHSYPSTTSFTKVHSCPSHLSSVPLISLDEEDEEISFKSPVKGVEAVSFYAPSLIDTPGGDTTLEAPGDSLPHFGTEPALESDISKPGGADPVTSKLINVPEPDKPSSPFKRSLSRSYSEDKLLISASSERRKSICQDPPRKAHKPSTRLKTQVEMDVPPPEGGGNTPNLQINPSSFKPPSDPKDLTNTTVPESTLMISNPFTASSKPSLTSSQSILTLTPGKSLTSSQSTLTLTPGKSLTSMKSSPSIGLGKGGRVVKAVKPDFLRKATLKTCHEKGLVRFTRSSVDLKQELDIPGGSKLEKADKKLSRSISRNCLRSFREYHSSPPDHPVKEIVGELMVIPDMLSSSSSLFRCVEEKMDGPGSPAKGECGTRGLTPLTNRMRICLLKANGVSVLDKAEAEEVKLLRESREKCGCSCQGVCVEGSCSCIDNDIECQSERPGFPCSCAHKNCGNPQGHRIYDKTEVELHYIQTIMSVQGAMDISEEDHY